MPPINEQRILITQAAAGMILSRPVAMQNKVSLCSRGMELNDGMITRLMSRGIKRIWVQGQPLPRPGKDAYLETIFKLRERFSRVRHVPIMVSLQQLVEKVLVRRL